MENSQSLLPFESQEGERKEEEQKKGLSSSPSKETKEVEGEEAVTNRPCIRIGWTHNPDAAMRPWLPHEEPSFEEYKEDFLQHRENLLHLRGGQELNEVELDQLHNFSKKTYWERKRKGVMISPSAAATLAAAKKDGKKNARYVPLALLTQVQEQQQENSVVKELMPPPLLPLPSKFPFFNTPQKRPMRMRDEDDDPYAGRANLFSAADGKKHKGQQLLQRDEFAERANLFSAVDAKKQKDLPPHLSGGKINFSSFTADYSSYGNIETRECFVDRRGRYSIRNGELRTRDLYMSGLIFTCYRKSGLIPSENDWEHLHPTSAIVPHAISLHYFNYLRGGSPIQIPNFASPNFLADFGFGHDALNFHSFRGTNFHSMPNPVVECFADHEEMYSTRIGALKNGKIKFEGLIFTRRFHYSDEENESKVVEMEQLFPLGAIVPIAIILHYKHYLLTGKQIVVPSFRNM